MKIVKKALFWISLLIGIFLFVVTYPFYHDMYIAEIFTIMCIMLNAASAILFSLFIYCLLTKNLDADIRSIFLGFTIMLAIVHGIFSMMNWGSWLFLGISIILLIYFISASMKEKKSDSEL